MVQVLVVKVDIGVLTYEAMTPPVLEVIGSGPDCQSGNRSVIYEAMTPPVWEVSDSGPGCQSGYRSVDL